MSRIDLRAQGDRDLYSALTQRPEIAQAIAKHAKDDALGARRHLLGTAVRLTSSMAPDLLAAIDTCRETLGITQQVETYVYPGADFNAAAVKPENDLLFVMFSSSILEAFNSDELRFVIGHELGHHAFGHHQLPVSALLSGETKPSPAVALQLFSWQRYAEISSDRAGFVCAGGLEPVASGLFKLASGLRTDRIAIDVGAFLRQAGDLRDENERLRDAEAGKARSDWFSTHPFSPLRLRAAQLFADSEIVAAGGSSRDVLESRVAELMGVMSPTYLKEKSEVAEYMRRLLLAAAVVVAHASDGKVSPAERTALVEMLGEDGVPQELDVEALRGDLGRRIEAVNNVVPMLRRAQIIRDLVVIARAEDLIADGEIAVINDIADRIGIGRRLVALALETPTELH